MAVTQCVTNQYLSDLANGRSFSSDTYKIALYTQATASLDETTTAYTATGEISGTGYTAGGLLLNGLTIAQDPSGLMYLSWNDPVWSSSNIAADAAMIYDSSNSDHSIAIFAFDLTSSDAAGDLHLYLPPVGTTALIVIKR